MTTDDVRAGISQARMTETAWNFVAVEFVILGIVSGAVTNSWGVGIVVVLACLGLLVFAATRPVLAWLLTGVMTLAWGALFFMLHPLAGVAAAICSYGAHISAIQHTRDLAKMESMRKLLIMGGLLLASAGAAHAQSNYDRHGNYIIRPPSVSTTITPQGTWTTTPINPQRPWAGSTTTGPQGQNCSTYPNNPLRPELGSTTTCR